MIKTKDRSCDFIPVEWIDEIQGSYRDSAKLEIHLSNWMRIRETNIWITELSLSKMVKLSGLSNGYLGQEFFGGGELGKKEILLF